jgi:hypothetical protein
MQCVVDWVNQGMISVCHITGIKSGQELFYVKGGSRVAPCRTSNQSFVSLWLCQ